MEWLGFIFMQIFNSQYYSNKKESVIKKITQLFKKEKICYYMLHMIGNYFQEMVDKRVTT